MKLMHKKLCPTKFCKLLNHSLIIRKDQWFRIENLKFSLWKSLTSMVCHKETKMKDKESMKMMINHQWRHTTEIEEYHSVEEATTEDPLDSMLGHLHQKCFDLGGIP